MRLKHLFLLVLVLIPIAVSAQDPLDGSVLQLEVEDVSLEDTVMEVEIEPTNIPTPTPEPEKNLLLHGVEREQFEDKGLVIRKTLPYLTTPSILGAGTADNRIIFENPQSGVPQQQSTTLTISSNNVFGFQTILWQRGKLSTLTGNNIEQTTCQIQSPCTPLEAATWKQNDIYGIGYRMIGASISGDFLQHNAFRPFPDASEKQVPVVVAYDEYSSITQNMDLEIKLNIPPSYIEGTYTDEVIIITLPRL